LLHYFVAFFQIVVEFIVFLLLHSCNTN
jgi:hypothetical protein